MHHPPFIIGVGVTAEKVAKDQTGTINCVVDGTSSAPTISFKDKDGNTVSPVANTLTVNLGTWGEKLIILLCGIHL